MALTMASLFSGSGGFELASLMHGITPLWASEIEPFPIRVTTKRLPFMKHYGDVSKINGAEVEPVDIITFGSQIAKGPGAVCSRAIVRRLTPTECARLQGFPDWWCDDLDEPNPTDEEMTFWREVFDTYSGVTGAAKKTDKAIAKWLEHPHSDSAEYKMWGNGVALPCVEYIMGRIAEFEGKDEYHPIVDAQWCPFGVVDWKPMKW